jgi:hypothetical protein
MSRPERHRLSNHFSITEEIIHDQEPLNSIGEVQYHKGGLRRFAPSLEKGFSRGYTVHCTANRMIEKAQDMTGPH